MMIENDMEERRRLCRANTARYPRNFVMSQFHCLEANEENPQPTTVPPPCAGMGGGWGERLVLVFKDMNLAQRLGRYLCFFQGAACRVLEETQIKRYLEETDETASQIEFLEDERLQHVDAGRIAIVVSSDPVTLHSKFPRVVSVEFDEETVKPPNRFVRICGETVVTHRVRSMLQLVKYLSHVHTRERTVYLTRHGESEYNLLKKIGGNPGLTPQGELYARWLGDYVNKFEMPTRLWTSSLRRTILTARHIDHRKIGEWTQCLPRVYRNLDEIYAGDFEGKTYDQIAKDEESECGLRQYDKLGYRYPRGESYLDLIARLDPLVHELESYKEPLIIVSHQATLRVLYAYLTNKLRSEAPKLAIPLHTLIKLTILPSGDVIESHITFNECSTDDGQALL